MPETILQKEYDVIIIGAGAAGMAAASKLCEKGLKPAIIDRENYLGGILVQCIHNGFGLNEFKKDLTGPEYAEKYIEKLKSSNTEIFLETTVVDINTENEEYKIVHGYSGKHGVLELKAKAIILAMGSRERNRGNIGIAGTRPSGIFTAGLAQRLLNIEGYIPGKKVVIIGSGDIGLIMARRLSWVGVKVLCVVEIQPYPSGLIRNITQCLNDFDIPLYLNHEVTEIKGKDRVEGVEISPIENGITNTNKSFQLDCDTVLLSVGLIPENELSRNAGIKLSPNTNGPIVNQNLESNVKGVFACGNVLHIHDLVDFVSREANSCAENVSKYIKTLESQSSIHKNPSSVPVKSGSNLKYVLPMEISTKKTSEFLMRPLIVCKKGELIIKQDSEIIKKKVLNYIHPAEMISVNFMEDDFTKLEGTQTIEFSLSPIRSAE